MGRRTARWVILVALSGLLVFLPALEAMGHGDIQARRPDEGATRKKPAGHVRIDFTEAPTEDSVVRVRDGCGEDVVREQYVEGRAKHVFLRRGRAQPGEWEVSYRVVSAEDGHQSRGSYNFTVRGDPECPVAAPDPEDEATEDEEDRRAAPGGPSGGDDEGFPVLPVAIGAGGIIGLAALVRIFSARGGA